MGCRPLHLTNREDKTMAYIVSKASQSIEYAGWSKGRNGLNKKEMSIIIKGGAHVIDKKTLNTPNGVITEVTDEELAFLKNNSSFKRHLDKGWMAIEKSKSGAEKLAQQTGLDKDGFVIKDGGSQLTKEDYERNGKKPPKVGGEE